MQKAKLIDATTQVTPQQAKKYTSLTDNQWAVYYYLLSLSDYNSIKREDHRYVYRDTFNITQMSKELGFTRATYYNSLKALEKKGLIDNSFKEYIILPLPKIYTQISRSLIKQLLYYRTSDMSIDLLRVYLFCSYMWEHYKENKPFTLRNVVKCLGHSDSRQEYYNRVEVSLDLLASWKLINFRTEMIEHEVYGKYRIYKITDVYASSKELDERFSQTGLMNNTDGLTEKEIEHIRKIFGIQEE